MKTKIVKIDGEFSVRLPVEMLKKAGCADEVDVRLVDSGILIVASNAPHPRAGWARAAKLMRARGEDELLDEVALTDFDESEWEWK